MVTRWTGAAGDNDTNNPANWDYGVPVPCYVFPKLPIRLEMRLNDDGSAYLFDTEEVRAWCRKHGVKIFVQLERVGENEAEAVLIPDHVV